MKKLITIALLCAMLLSCLASCGMQKGEINIADEANVQNVVNVPEIPTKNVSKWTGGDISNKNDQVTLDATTGKATCSVEGSDLSWFDPKSKNHELLDAADLVGFLKLRLMTTTAAFKDNYKAYTGEDLNAFAGHTFTLKANVDLNGVNLACYNSAYIFAGTFDGGGNAIFNYKMTGVNSGNKGFFSQLTGEACLKDLSLLECTVEVVGQADTVKKQSDDTYKLTNNAKGIYGVAVGVLATEEGKTITIQNVYTSGVVQNGTDTKCDVFAQVSGVVGVVSGKGTAIIDGCASTCTLDLDGTGSNITLTSDKKDYTTGKSYYGQYTSGIVSGVTESTNVTISNCSFDGKILSANNSIAGILARLDTTGTVEITGCSVSGEIDTTQTTAGGIIGQVNYANNITIDGCETSGNISAKGQVGGIVGYVYYTKNKTISKIALNDCIVTGTVKGTAENSTGGLIGRLGYYDEAKASEIKAPKIVEITGCEVNATVQGKNYTGGFIGYVNTSISSRLTIKDSSSNSTVTGGVNCGAVIGYMDRTVNALSVTNTVVDGSLSCGRASGGVVGYLQSKTTTLDNVHVKATLDFNLSDKKNQNAGGLIGRVNSCTTLKITDCIVDGTMTVNYNSSATAEDGVATTYAGGLIGYFNSVGTAAQILNCKVGTAEDELLLTLTRTNTAVDAHMGVTIGGARVGGSGEQSTVEHINVTNNLSPLINGDVKILPAADNMLNGLELSVVGYQTRDNGNGTYDLRYVIAAKDVFDGLGVRASIRYVDKNGVFDEMNQKIYVGTVYSYLMGMDENDDYFYAAEDYYYDYFYTLVVKGVPEEYTFEDDNLQVILRPFGATNENGVVTEKGIGYLNQGKYLSNTSAKDAGITVDNFSKTLDEKFTAEDVVYIPGGSYDTSISEGINPHQPDDAEVAGAYKEGTVEKPTHYYLDVKKSLYADYAFLNITYNFKVAESGWYDMCIDMRMKGSGTDFNGSNKRETLMLVDWVGGERAYDIGFELDSVLDVRNDSAGSYMSGLKIWLEAGEHTLTFTADPSFGTSYYHIRGIYLVQAN